MACQQRGFTLIESMTVLALLALGLGLGLPLLGDAMERQRLHTCLHLLATDLAMARSTAVMRREAVVLCPGHPRTGCRSDSNWSDGWLVFRDPDGNRQPDAASDLLRASSAPAGGREGLQLRSTRPWLRYQPSGLAAHSNLTIHACSRDRLRGKVVVSRIGRARTERPARERPCP